MLVRVVDGYFVSNRVIVREIDGCVRSVELNEELIGKGYVCSGLIEIDSNRVVVGGEVRVRS